METSSFIHCFFVFVFFNNNNNNNNKKKKIKTAGRHRGDLWPSQQGLGRTFLKSCGRTLSLPGQALENSPRLPNVN